MSLVICGGAMGKMGNSIIKSLPDLAEQHKVLVKWATEQLGCNAVLAWSKGRLRPGWKYWVTEAYPGLCLCCSSGSGLAPCIELHFMGSFTWRKAPLRQILPATEFSSRPSIWRIRKPNQTKQMNHENSIMFSKSNKLIVQDPQIINLLFCPVSPQAPYLSY